MFVGKVTDVFNDRPSHGFADLGSRRFVFEVHESFGTALGATVEVLTDMSSCGAEFVRGQTYLVDAGTADDGTIVASACSYTQFASSASTEIEILRRMASGKPHRAIFGQLIESRKPGPTSRATDPDLWQPLRDVPVVISGGTRSYHATTDGDGRFAVWNLPKGRYRLELALPPPLKLEKYFRGFHQADANPDLIQLAECPARVTLVARGW